MEADLYKEDPAILAQFERDPDADPWGDEDEMIRHFEEREEGKCFRS